MLRLGGILPEVGTLHFCPRLCMSSGADSGAHARFAALSVMASKTEIQDHRRHQGDHQDWDNNGRYQSAERGGVGGRRGLR